MKSSVWIRTALVSLKSFCTVEVAPCFFAFDLLWLNDIDLCQTPLIERKKKLQGLIQRGECSEIIYSQHVERDGKLLFQEVCERNLEGIVCKRRMGVYSEHGWLKIKNPKYTQAEGRHEMFEAFHEGRKSGKIGGKSTQ